MPPFDAAAEFDRLNFDAAAEFDLLTKPQKPKRDIGPTNRAELLPPRLGDQIQQEAEREAKATPGERADIRNQRRFDQKKNESVVQAVTEDALARQPKYQSFGKALLAGIDDAQMLAAGGLEATAEVLGGRSDVDATEAGFLDTAALVGREGREGNTREADQYGRRGKFADINSVGDAFSWASQTAGNMVPVMVPAIVGGAVGASAAPVIGVSATVGGVVGAFIPSLAISTGEVQASAKEKDPTSTANGWTFAGGTAIAALDSILPGRIGGKLIQKFGREGAEEIAMRTLIRPAGAKLAAEVAKGALKEGGKSAVIEGVTESLQEAIGEVAASMATESNIDWEGLPSAMLESGAAGALMGGLSGGPTGAVSTLNEQRADPIGFDNAPPIDIKQDVPLTESDIASPLGNEIIQRGKNIIADALGENRPLKPEVEQAPPPVAPAAPIAKAKQPTVTAPFDKIVQITLGAESGNRDFDANGNVLTSPAGAQGKMQVMPGTNTDPGFGVRPAKDNSLAERARVGRDYLAAMLKRYGGDFSKMWAAYNWGPGALDKAIAKHGDGWLDHAPAETRKYVTRNVAKLGGAGFNPNTGDVQAVIAPEQEALDSEDALGFAKRVLGDDFLDAAPQESVSTDQTVIEDRLPEQKPSEGVGTFSGDPAMLDFMEKKGIRKSLNVPRSEMPQIKAENRAAMVNFLKARGIESKEITLSSESLFPTQAEFSREKIEKAKNFEGGNRSILVSSDWRILDGHHQWLAALEKGVGIKVIRLDAPIGQLIDTVKEMPSTETEGAQAAVDPEVIAEDTAIRDAEEQGIRDAENAADDGPQPDDGADIELTPSGKGLRISNVENIDGLIEAIAAVAPKASPIKDKRGGVTYSRKYEDKIREAVAGSVKARPLVDAPIKTAERPAVAAESVQGKAYREFLAKHGAPSAGLRNQMLVDERLNDGEAESILSGVAGDNIKLTEGKTKTRTNLERIIAEAQIRDRSIKINLDPKAVEAARRVDEESKRAEPTGPRVFVNEVGRDGKTDQERGGPIGGALPIEAAKKLYRDASNRLPDGFTFLTEGEYTAYVIDEKGFHHSGVGGLDMGGVTAKKIEDRIQYAIKTLKEEADRIARNEANPDKYDIVDNKAVKRFSGEPAKVIGVDENDSRTSVETILRSGQKIHWDYEGTAGRTAWIEQTDSGWVGKTKDDDYPTVTSTKGGAGAGGGWTMSEAIEAIWREAKHRVEAYKPTEKPRGGSVDLVHVSKEGTKVTNLVAPRPAPTVPVSDDRRDKTLKSVEENGELAAIAGDPRDLPKYTIGDAEMENRWLVGYGKGIAKKSGQKPDFAGAVNKDLSKDQVEAAAAIFDNAEKAAKPSTYGKSNKFVTAERRDVLRERLAAKLADQKSLLKDTKGALDTEMMMLGAELAAFHIEAGSRKFAEVAKALADDLGVKMDEIRPFLRTWYNGARDMMEDSGENVDGMDDAETVKAELRKLAGNEPVTPSESTEVTPAGVNNPPLSTPTLETAFIDAFQNGAKFDTIVQARKLAERTTGEKYDAGTQNAKILDETIEAAVTTVGRQIVARGGTVKAIYEELVDLYSRQPKLSVRSSTSVSQQAYSTPVPLAYVASRLAGINADTIVYEPTAGNGALLIDSNPANVRANELNPGRAETLRANNIAVSVTENDATEFKPAGEYDVIIANPPFGVVRDDAGNSVSFNPGGERYHTNEIDHAIALKALEVMKDDGKAVLLVGGISPLITKPESKSDAYNSKAKRAFYLTLYKQYNVVDHFTASGALYERQGAGWPVDVIVIEGRGKSALSLPAVSVPRQYASWDALSEVLNDEKRNQISRPVREPDVDSSEQGQQPGRVDESDTRSSRERGDTGRERVNTPVEPSSVRDGPVGEQPASVDVGQPRDGVDETADDQQQRAVDRRPSKRVELTENDKQVTYQPESPGASAMGTLVPINMQDSLRDALQKLTKKHGNIDNFVADRLKYDMDGLYEAFAAEQIDAVALAIDNIEKGGGFIIGDQTGIGKGRVVAGIIRYAIIEGRTPVFFTEKDGLYKDMYRDMEDIGLQNYLGRDIEALMTNAQGKVPLDDDATRFLKTPAAEKHNAHLMDLAENGLEGSGVDVIFTTYSQAQSMGDQPTPRRDALRSFIKGGILILDESHNAGGAATGFKKKDAPQTRAEFLRELVGLAHGVFYSSATYAKRPDVMDLYSATDMRLAVDDLSKLGEAIAKGGVPMQQVVASMLTRAGQYVRRERSFDGIAYNTPTVDIDPQQYSDTSTILKSIQDFSEGYVKDATAILDEQIKAEGESITNDNATGAAGAQSTTFTSIMHNIVDQMLLAFKADAAADMAIAAIQRGEKPVITVANTLEAMLNEYAEQDGVKIGEQIDITFADVFRRYLERTRIVGVKDAFAGPKDKPKKVRLTDAQLGPDGVQAFQEALDLISGSTLDLLPGSPLDYMLSKIQQGTKTNEKGETLEIKMGEITGRTYGINYRNGKAYLKARGTKDKSTAGKLKSIVGFNDGHIDAMLLNRSGSTGLSIHASEKFKDQRKRRMIIAQAEGNIDTHMQMLGRVHRTGQVVLPEYDQIVAGVPAEKRPAAVLAKKMASLNANTTASRDSALTSKETLDFMNQYGDEVVANIMAEEPELHYLLGEPLADKDEGYEQDGAARKVTGRIPLLPVQVQEELYDRIEDEYRALLEQKDAAGENALEAKTIDLQAVPVDSLEVVARVAGTDSPFGAAVMAETVSVLRQGKPYTSVEVVEQVANTLGVPIPEGTPQEAVEQMLRDTDQQQREAFAAVVQEARDFSGPRIERMKDEKAKERATARLIDAIDTFQSITRNIRTGSGVRISTEMGNHYGIVTNISKVGTTKNPLALGSWKVQIATADNSRTFTIPMSYLTADQVAGPGETKIEPATRSLDLPIIEAFDQFKVDFREERVIVTGNLLAGFDWVAARGSIINYTTEDGAIKQGILMRRGFDVARHQQSRPVPITSSRAIIEFLKQVGGQLIGNGRSGAVSVQIDDRDKSLVVTAARTKKAGGEFFGNTDLTKALGTDFYSTSMGMVARAPIAKAESALQVLLDYGAKFEVKASVDDEIKDQARDIMERFAPRLSRSDPQQRRETQTGAKPAGRQRWADIEKKLRSEVSRMNLGDAITVNAVHRIFNDPTIEGKYEGRIIEIALGTTGRSKPEFVLNHEFIHAMRDLGLFKPSEWTALSKAALADAALMRSIERRYNLPRPMMIEEAIADMYAKWRQGRIQSGFIRSAFERIRNLLAVIRRAIVGANLQDQVETILKDIESGKIGARTRGETSNTGPREMVAYHGGPTDHDRFSTEFIGTGEGAQVYGWGLYFAGKKSVAEFYRNALTRSSPNKVIWKGKSWSELKDSFNTFSDDAPWSGDKWDALMALDRVEVEGTVDKAIDFQKKLLGKFPSDANRTTLAWLESHRDEISVEKKGKLFEVNIPEDAEYLLWDTAISKQSQSVRDAVAKIEAHLESVGAMDEIAERLNIDSLQELAGAELVRSALRIAADNDALPFEGEIGAKIQEPIERSGHYEKSISIWLNELGIPGTKYLDGGSRSKGDGTFNYVIFDDSNVEILAKFSRAESELLDIGNDLAKRTDKIRVKMQDRMLPLLRVQQRIESLMGRELPEWMQPYNKEELMTSKIAAQLEALNSGMVEPLADALEAEGITTAELETYLYARHAPERNARISEINPEFEEGTGSGMTDAEAGGIMVEAESTGKLPALERLAAKVDQILSFGLHARVEAGLMTEEDAEAWTDQYQFYVPLRGFAEMDAEGAIIDRPRSGAGINVRGKESQMAFGRESKAANILGYSILQAQEAIVRAQKNEVGKALHALAKQHPDDNFWKITKTSRKPYFDKKTGAVRYRITNNIDARDEPYTVSLKIEGKEQRVTFNRDNPSAVQVVRAMRLVGSSDGEALHYLSMFNRYYSGINTRWNPEFLVSNAFRDIQTGIFNSLNAGVDGLTKRVAKDYRKAFVASMKGSFGYESGEWGEVYREFVEAGGPTAYNRLDDVDKLKERFEARLNKKTPDIRGAVIAVRDLVENVNNGVENAIRLSAFKNARELGATKDQAASIAKNLTVNFNRRGEWATAVNAAYAFYNATVQGNTRLITGIVKGGKVSQAAAASLVVLGFGLDLLNASLSDIGDDDEMVYDKLSEYEKSHNIILMMPGEDTPFIKLPLAYGLNVLLSAGRSASEIWRGHDWKDVAGNLLGTIADAFNPVGGTDNIMNFLSPTITDPLVDIEQNRDFAGRPIYPRENPFGPDEADSSEFWAGTSEKWRAAAQFLNSISGGDEVIPGSIDAHPETLRFLFGSFTGAAGSFVDRSVTLVEKGFTGEDVEINDIPFVRKVVGAEPSWYPKAAYYTRKEQVEETIFRAKQYRENEEYDKAADYENQHADILDMKAATKSADKAMRRVRKARAGLEKDLALDYISKADHKAEMEIYKSEEDAIIAEFNSEYLFTVTKPKRP